MYEFGGEAMNSINGFVLTGSKYQVNSTYIFPAARTANRYITKLNLQK